MLNHQNVLSDLHVGGIKNMRQDFSLSMAKYFHRGAAIMAWWNSSFLSILMTSSRSNSTTLISSDSSRCYSDKRSTPTARKVWLLLVQAPALGLTVMRWLHSPPP